MTEGCVEHVRRLGQAPTAIGAGRLRPSADARLASIIVEASVLAPFIALVELGADAVVDIMARE